MTSWERGRENEREGQTEEQQGANRGDLGEQVRGGAKSLGGKIEQGIDNIEDTLRGRQDDLEWVLATPKDTDSGFEKVYLGFKNDVLQEMELHDNFGHMTVIEFSKLERNPKLSAQTFVFKPPAGADVSPCA